MFRKMQFKMALYFSAILSVVIAVSFVSIYLMLYHYNKMDLLHETESMLKMIDETDWLADADDQVDDESYEESESTDRKQKHGAITVFETKEELVAPVEFSVFNGYLIFDRTKKCVLSNFVEPELEAYYWQLNKELPLNGDPVVHEIEGTKDVYLLLVKQSIRVNGNNYGTFIAGKDITLAYETLENLRLIMLVSTLIGIFFAFILGFVISGRTIWPIRKAYKAKERFVADASHELRTPVSVILLSTDTLESEIKEDNAFLQEAIDDIRNEALQMKTLIERLLFLARNDASSIVLKQERVNLTELLMSLIRSYSHLVYEKKILLTKELEDSLIIEGESNLLNSVFSILIDNGIKYNRVSGELKICATRFKDTVKVRVQDSGIGIEEKDLANIFERFYRVDKSRVKKEESVNDSGYGLGLSIAYEIIKQHKGSIEVESKVGEGSCFTVTLPISH